jgi:hypothetical protein
LSQLNWREGDLAAALRHAQLSVRFAQDARDAERTAWAQLHLLRLLIENGSPNDFVGILPDVRRAVTRAGVGQATAYFHTCIAILEGQTGRLEESRRHCELTNSLLDSAPSLWLKATTLVNLGCVAVLQCQFERAAQLNCTGGCFEERAFVRLDSRASNDWLCASSDGSV